MRKSISRAQPAPGQAHPAPPPRRPRHDQDPIMDIEHINAIGKHIADLSERTTALRGYL
ncbi:MAG: hypothetical protein ABIR54_24385 [Burkholderiaceae bacterium]